MNTETLRKLIRPGDGFVSDNPQGLGKLINPVQRFWSADDASEYGHAGIIQNSLGLTLESLWRVDEKNLFQYYAGAEILVARPNKASEFKKKAVISKLRKEHLGQMYPYWRLALHLIPPLAKNVSANGKFLVCSELVGKYLWQIGHRHSHYLGTNPDTLADEWVHWRNMDIVWEGTLDKDWKP
jgi:hypothetical protein